MEVDEEEDQLAKTALKQTQAKFKVSINTAEIKRLIMIEVRKKWQNIWADEKEGSRLYQVRECVGAEGIRDGNRRKDVIISRWRIGNAALHYSLRIKGKHELNVMQNDGERFEIS